VEQSAKDLYLDLMKRTLSFSLWPSPPFPIEFFNYLRSFPKREIVSVVTNILSRARLQLAHLPVHSIEERESGQLFSVFADTMIGLKRLDNLQFCIESIVKEGVSGDLIETGVWRGGACIFMRAVLAAYGVTDRRVFVADSFEGLPKPDTNTYPMDKGDTHYLHQYFAVSRAAVENNFRRYNLLDEQVVFLEGWFKDTLPAPPISASPRSRRIMPALPKTRAAAHSCRVLLLATRSASGRPSHSPSRRRIQTLYILRDQFHESRVDPAAVASV